MHISQLAKLSGLSIDTVRYYEKQDLLDEHHFERLTNNYRSYTPAALDRLELIKCAKLFGFTLAEIKALINDMLRLKTFINCKITLLRRLISTVYVAHLGR